MDHSSDKMLCPSARATTGSKLIGIRQADGTVAILPETLPVTQQFVDTASAGGKDPQQHFRFTNKCVEHGCKQWTGSRCGVADRIVEEIETLINFDENNLPACSIRSQCRWYNQWNYKACNACPYVVTKITEEEINAFIAAHGEAIEQ